MSLNDPFGTQHSDLSHTKADLEKFYENSPRLGETRAVTPIMKYFECGHLPVHLQVVSAKVRDLAIYMDQSLPNGPEKTTGLRKLLESKDCFVRAYIDTLPSKPTGIPAVEDKKFPSCF